MSRPRSSTAARSRIRAWWPEALALAVLAAVSAAGPRDDLLFGVFEAIVAVIFWSMGFRHRHLPLAAAIHDTHERMRRVESKLDEAAAREQGPSRPMGKIIPFRRHG